ncbi:phosphoadenosine phosphosulfate reductase family protein [Francisellaceae bacterium]|nr:phosphoadenosine phosphosulfate reductase family protein [Francisellaceae bacterium]
MNVIITNFGDDSIALIQWAYEQKLEELHILSVDTGWEASTWHQRIQDSAQWVKTLGIKHEHLQPQATFPENVMARQRFPNKKFHWCPSFVKGLAILDWLEMHDESYEATILLANRKDMVPGSLLEEFIEEHEHYDDRKVWHPLYALTEIQRNQLITKTPLAVLNHRSLECQPCIYNSANDFQSLSDEDCERVVKLEDIIKAPMFHPMDHQNAQNVAEIRAQALKEKTDNHHANQDFYKAFASSCSWSYGCGL